MTTPQITRARMRACANLAVIAERRRARAAGEAARQHAENRREARAYTDHIPLYDADWVAVYELAHALRDFTSHTGPGAPTGHEKPPGEQARQHQRQERSRLRATCDAERWLAIWALGRGGTGATSIAELLDITDRQVERWRRRPVVGWPHDIDAVLLPRTGVGPTQNTTDTRTIGDHGYAA